MKINYDKIASELEISEEDRIILAFGMIPKELADMLEKNFKFALFDKHEVALGREPLSNEEAEKLFKALPIHENLVKEFNHGVTVALMRKYTKI